MDKKPIILIPGIQGTKLSNINNSDFRVIWSGIKKYFSDIHSLTLQFDGKCDKGAENIVERADVENLAYSEIVNYLRSLGYRVFIFGYDWRKSNADTAELLAIFVKKIQRKLRESKINFITHSMGGLVLSAYFKLLANNASNEDPINRVIMTVPPFLGSVEATFNMVIGKSRLFNSSDDFRKIARTFPGLYELLPVYDTAYTFEDTHENQAFDYFNFDYYWQQVDNVTKDKTKQKHRLINHRLKELREVRSENNLIFDFNSLEEEYRKKIIILIGGGEKTKNKVLIKENYSGYKYYFDFEHFEEVDDVEGGDGTVPLESSTYFKNAINTLRLDTTWIEKRADSRFFMSDWHAFFLNNGRVQNIIKRFFDPQFQYREDWYQSGGKRVELV